MASKAKIYLYKEGNECENITGGWITQDITGRIPSIIGNIDNKLYLNSANDKMGILKCYNSLNLSMYSNLYVDTENSIVSSTYTFTKIGLWDKLDFYNNNITFGYEYTKSYPRQILDISLKDVLTVVYVGFCCNCYTQNTLSIYNMWLKTKENVISINSQDTSSINFSCNDLDNLITITKTEVYINNILSETYEDTFDNLTYNIDNSLCTIGKNNISIKVTYTQGDDIYETVEEILTHTATVNNLPTTSSLKDVIDRQELLNNSIEIQKNNLKNILVGKNVEVTEEDKMSILIDKVDLLGKYDDGKLWLYKDGDNLKNISKVAKNENGNGVISVSFDNECIKIINNENSTLGATSNNALSIGINSKIDISKYTKIKCEFTSIVNNYNTGKTSIILLSSSNYTYNTWQEDYVGVFSKYRKQLGNETKSIVECDITNINELSYISVNVVGNNSMRSASVSIHKIWLEK